MNAWGVVEIFLIRFECLPRRSGTGSAENGPNGVHSVETEGGPLAAVALLAPPNKGSWWDVNVIFGPNT